MSQINITCHASTRKRWRRIFYVMGFGLFLFLSFNIYGDKPDEFTPAGIEPAEITPDIIMDQDGNWDECKFGKFTKGYVLKVLINIDKNLVLRDILKEENKVREKKKLPPLTVEEINLEKYIKKDDKTNQAIHICLTKDNNTAGDKVISYYFTAEITEQDRSISPVPTFKGGDFKIEKGVHLLALPEKKEKPGPPFGKKEFKFHFAEAGKKYTVSIKRYSTLDDKLKQTNAYKIFTMDFFTYHRFKLGLHTGVFFPFSRFKSFSLNYNNTSVENDQKAFVDEGTYWEPKVIFFVSYYFAGFEPESKRIGGRFCLNIGTELSSAIFKKLYFGFGYSFNYFSVSLFCSYGKKDKLAKDYPVGTVIENPNITAVPLEKEEDLRAGLVLSFPMDIATGLLGKLLGI